MPTSDDATRLLEKAKTLLSDQSRWTMGVLARNRFGDAVSPRNKDASCFCAFGALTASTFRTHSTTHLEAIARLNKASKAMGYYSAAALNDATFRPGAINNGVTNNSEGHAKVMTAYDKAIAEDYTP